MSSRAHPLRVWREQAAVTQTEVANEIGVVPSFITMIEQDKRTPSLETAAKLSKLTGIPIEDFIREMAE